MRTDSVCKRGLMAAAALVALAACRAEATGEPVPTTGGAQPVPSPSAAKVAAGQDPRTIDLPVAMAEVACPAMLGSGLPLPNGGRVLGAPVGSAIALSSATVTADAVTAIAGDLSGLAEVEPEDGPGSTDMTTQLQDARPAADTAFALVCRYGDPKPPLLARSVLLLPLPAFGGTYRCTTRLPPGRDRRPVSAVCRRS